MDRINAIYRHPLFTRKTEEICEAEQDRIYCRHDVEHLLDVARLMYIQVLEEGLTIRREMIYAAALLHDIGRADQYLTGRSHDEAGAETAEQILADCGFDPEDRTVICDAIRGHRGDYKERGKEEQEPEFSDSSPQNRLAELLKSADKRSRNCFSCKAADTCKWPDEKKNMEIRK